MNDKFLYGKNMGWQQCSNEGQCWQYQRARQMAQYAMRAALADVCLARSFAAVTGHQAGISLADCRWRDYGSRQGHDDSDRASGGQPSDHPNKQESFE